MTPIDDASQETPASDLSAEMHAADQQNPLAQPPHEDASILPVVGIGGSAGSIPVLQDLFERLPSNLGLSYVVVIHLAPSHESALSQILQNHTGMPVTQVKGDTKIEPNTIYVIPPAHHLAMRDGIISLTKPQQDRGRRVAVDLFFRTLAATHKSKAVAIVLSGVDGDGAIGIKHIKEQGGVTIVQEPGEAEFDGMPRTAIETGMVDWILTTDQIVHKLQELVYNERRIHLPASNATQSISEVQQEDIDETALRGTLSFLHSRTGHDFSHYKRATVLRRIMRRLQVNSLESLPQYANFLRTHPGECGALLQDLLISVTNFFRDPDAFQALSAHIPNLFSGKSAGDAVRVWVAGCASGEEAYSLAMLLIEHADTMESAPEIHIFATDLDEQALRHARDGTYPATIIADVSPDRLRRFFVLDQGRYRVKKEVRARVLFAPHNLLKDAPFSRLDLVSCRNLMIYFDRQAQERVLEVFHFALKPGALLFLGSSESAEGNTLFSPQDKRHRIYERHAISRSLPLPLMPLLMNMAPPPIPEITRISNLTPMLPSVPALVNFEPRSQSVDNPSISFSELHVRMLEHLGPPSLLVNNNYEILHLSEQAGRYLQLGGGAVSLNLLNAVPAAARSELHIALLRAMQSNENVDLPGLPFAWGSQERPVAVRIRPLRQVIRNNEVSGFALVIFDEPREDDISVTKLSVLPSDEVVRRLEAELEHLNSYLRSSIEQYEASSEELKASNEELQAMNEEQRSASEELETSREEIQAANEELITLNSELKSKIEEVSRTNSNLQNLMASTDIATIFLSRDLRIKRYTPRAEELFRLIPSDTGRPLDDLRHGFDNATFIKDAEQVVRTLQPLEREVATADGRWFLSRIAPYRTVEDKIDGVVLAFVDISARKRAEKKLLEARDELERRVQERTQELQDEAARRGQLEEERKALTQRIVNVQEEERKRISRELHDNMSQHLAAILMNLRSFQEQLGDRTAKEQEALNQVILQVSELATVSHRLAWELRPSALDDLGLGTALQQYVNRWAEEQDIAVDFLARSPEPDSFSSEISTSIYRVVQEALTNVAQHAQATHVSVILERNATTLTAIIEDNGVGFNPEDAMQSERLGLRGMQERLDLIGGKLQIESRKRHGTTLYARVPFVEDL